jgi:hypothetical protein
MPNGDSSQTTKGAATKGPPLKNSDIPLFRVRRVTPCGAMRGGDKSATYGEATKGSSKSTSRA